MPNLPVFPTDPQYNIYKGARYVPLIMGAWDATVEYEPLSIVIVEGNSYTSKWYVPAGVPVTNADYWVETGNYNGQIAQLTENLNDLTEDVNKNAADIASNSADISTLWREFYSPIRGKNIVFVGDSWCVGGSASSPSLRFSTLLANSLRMNEINLGVGGAGFTRPDTFLSQITGAAISLTPQQKNDTSIVLIIGGVNDLRNMSSTSISAYGGAIQACIEEAAKTFPNALIVLAINTSMLNSYSETMQYWTAYGQEAARQVHTAPTIIINNIDAVTNGNSAMYQSDNLHLTDLGHSILAGFLASTIQGGGNNICYYHGTLTLAETVSVITTPHAFRRNGIVHWTAGEFSFPQTDSQILLGSISQDILPKTNIYTPAYRSNKIAGNFALTASGNFYYIPESAVNNCYMSDFIYSFT